MNRVISKYKLPIVIWLVFEVIAFSIIFVLFLFVGQFGELEKIMFWCFVIGNIFYYLVGIILAFKYKDNRAFCKYICPITIF